MKDDFKTLKEVPDECIELKPKRHYVVQAAVAKHIRELEAEAARLRDVNATHVKHSAKKSAQVHAYRTATTKLRQTLKGYYECDEIRDGAYHPPLYDRVLQVLDTLPKESE